MTKRSVALVGVLIVMAMIRSSVIGAVSAIAASDTANGSFSIFLPLILNAFGPCTEVDLYTSPTNANPPNHSHVGDLRPVLTWDWSEACSPTEYIVNLWTNATNGTMVDTGFGGTTGDSGRDWSPSVDLTPGTAYLWHVAAMNGTMIGTYSELWEFIVGP